MALVLVSEAAKLFTRLGSKELNPEEEEELVKRIFQHYDTDASGLIDPVEFGVMTTQLGFQLSPAEAAEVISGIDTDGNGLIDFKEFLGWYRDETGNLSKTGQKKRLAILKKLRDDLAIEKIEAQFSIIPGGRDPKKERAQEMFKAFDTDDNKVIDVDEFAAMCLQLGLTWSKKRVKEEFKKIDSDGSGGIDFKEFYRWWRNYRKDQNKQMGNDLRAALDEGFSAKDFKEGHKPKVLTLQQQKEFFLNMAGSSFTPSFQSLTLLNKIQDIVNTKFEGESDSNAIHDSINKALEELRVEIGIRSAANKEQLDSFLNTKAD
jgi:Ca2+-binding EF-hand superfamily protein